MRNSKFSFQEMHLKMLSAKWRPFCLCLNVLTLLGADSILRCHLTSIGNPIVEIRRPYDHLISTMGFPILVRWHLYIESGPWCWNWNIAGEPSQSYGCWYRAPCIISMKGIDNTVLLKSIVMGDGAGCRPSYLRKYSGCAIQSANISRRERFSRINVGNTTCNKEYTLVLIQNKNNSAHQVLVSFLVQCI